MNLVIRKMTPDMVEDFLEYFDHEAFKDHPEWAGCYCLESHVDVKTEEELKPLGVQGRREKARELVLSGVMQGYLAYDDKKVIGWCNSSDIKSYCRICPDQDTYEKQYGTNKVKIAYCFDISPDYRGQGIASKMLERICEDAPSEGFQYVDGCVWKEDFGAFAYHGPMKLYEKCGFEICAETPLFYVVRKRVG